MFPKITSRNPRFLLMYSPQQFDVRYGAIKPEGSLGLAYLAGALRDDQFDVTILDASVGNDNYTLADTFYRQKELESGMIRIGMTADEIVHEVSGYDVIGITSIFTAQTKMVIEVIEAIKKAFPDKLIIVGGVNARSLSQYFFNAGAHIVCNSEGEGTIIEIARQLRNGRVDLSAIKGISFVAHGNITTTCSPLVLANLDHLPFPAWDLQPLAKYWEIARPHGGGFKADGKVAYAPIMTSRGCAFRCSFCHIAKEGKDSQSGNLRELRLKSEKRVLEEIETLKKLGVEHFFIEDDSLLGAKDRALAIFRALIKYKVKLSGVNGINISHLCTTRDGANGVDIEILEVMAEAGFKKIMLPVESGSQRIIRKYATDKLNLEENDIVGLIRAVKALGMNVGGNYTFGYPDETFAEVEQTFEIAKVHMDAGLDNANFMIITPFPGTRLYDLVERESLWLPGTNILELDWTKLAIKTIVPAGVYEEMMSTGWKSINRPDRIKSIESMRPSGDRGIEIIQK